MTARALRDNKGRAQGSVIAFTDVTALIKAMTVKDRFVATISHELRTPLPSILGYLELILDDPNLGQAPELGVIERNAEPLLTLVDDLLMIASDDRDLELRETHFSNILERAVAAARPDASAKGLQIRIDLDGTLPVRLDSGQMHQVVQNLLSNAIKFSPAGSGESPSRHGATARSSYAP